MPWPTEFYAHQVIIFTLVLVRVSALVMVAPIFGSSEVPTRIRGLLAVALALMIVPLELQKETSTPENVVDYLVLVGAETLVGLTLGLGILVLFSGVQVAGQVISQMSGLQLADVFNPGFDSDVPVFSQLLYYVAMAVFVIIGGHRKVMEALLDTFVWLPAGAGGFSRSITDAMTGLLAQSFELGVRAAAPAMVALLLATLVLGLISRTLPQLNVMNIGFGINTGVTLGTLCISLGAGAWIFADRLEGAIELLLAALRSA